MEGELEEEYIYRICSLKDVIGTWNDVAVLLNNELGYEFKESKYCTDCEYILYVHINKTNNKKYFGITSIGSANRWRADGSGYKKQQLFWRAIRKYGWDNFEHIILFENISENNAKKLEYIFIKIFNTTNPIYGYNVSLGGSSSTKGLYNNKKMSVPVYQYLLNGMFLKKYPSSMEAERQTGIPSSNTISCCKGKHMYTKEFRWSYDYCDRLPYFDKKVYKYETATKKQQKKVYQYNLNGKFIKEYISLSSAAKENGLCFKSISDCCRGRIKQYKNFIWRYEYSEKVEPVLPRYVRSILTRNKNKAREVSE